MSHNITSTGAHGPYTRVTRHIAEPKLSSGPIVAGFLVAEHHVYRITGTVSCDTSIPRYLSSSGPMMTGISVAQHRVHRITLNSAHVPCDTSCCRTRIILGTNSGALAAEHHVSRLRVSLTTPHFSSQFSCAPNWARFCPNRHLTTKSQFCPLAKLKRAELRH